MATPDIDHFIGLERRVWDALVTGDPQADGALLAEDFVGLYPSGFADRADHMGQLANGPTAEAYKIGEARLIELSDTSAMLCYRADWQRPGRPEPEAMYVSSLWTLRDGEWLNVFSQDCPVEAT